jgi:serine/threonine-protein kinase
MAPEQASGERHIDARADLYALGIVGYEMIAGQLPFSGPSAQAMLAAHLTTPPPSLAKTRPDVPAGVAVATDGSLLVADDDGDTIWRVTFKCAACTPDPLPARKPVRR